VGVSERAFMSIGEVLTLLKDEFPDVTISKIRFLESQGLLDPERTPSGYRKFYDTDVERLRWILRQQREHFLPLKVIKGRLAGAVRGSSDDDASAAEGNAAASPSRGGAGRRPRVDEPGDANPLVTGVSGANLTVGELAAASGLEADELDELERYGIITAYDVGGTPFYDENALVVANLAAGFMKFGVEARHLRMYRNAGEREASFFEQVVMPMLKQRNPEAHTQAVETLGELARLGQALRAAMLRQALHEYLS
jgi:DNA-binding transcriptional MerR regulator